MAATWNSKFFLAQPIIGQQGAAEQFREAPTMVNGWQNPFLNNNNPFLTQTALLAWNLRAQQQQHTLLGGLEAMANKNQELDLQEKRLQSLGHANRGCFPAVIHLQPEDRSRAEAPTIHLLNLFNAIGEGNQGMVMRSCDNFNLNSKRQSGSSDMSIVEIKSTTKRARGSVKCDKSDDKLPSTLSGEHRLAITFEKFGSKGAVPQMFGNSGVLIPDGLIGTHIVYEQKWRFEIYHGEIVDDICACITWKVTNLCSGTVHTRTETTKEAKMRIKIGRTIMNQVFQDAMRMRAAALELLLEQQEMSDIKRSNIKSLVQTLRPGRFTMGPLVFGLQHKIVQEKIGNTTVLK